MNEEEFKRLEKLADLYNWSEEICDPIDYFNRKKCLLSRICKFLLEPYEKEVEKREKKKDE